MIGIGDNIRALREERGFTQADLARMTEIDEKYISAIERGARSPGRKTISKLCEAFAVDEQTVRFGERRATEEEKPQTPEHLKLLFEMIANAFPTPSSLIEKDEALTKVLRELRDVKD